MKSLRYIVIGFVFILMSCQKEEINPNSLNDDTPCGCASNENIPSGHEMLGGGDGSNATDTGTTAPRKKNKGADSDNSDSDFITDPNNDEDENKKKNRNGKRS